MVTAPHRDEGDPVPRPAPGRVRSLSFHGLRSLADTRLDLASRFTVLVGANGAGKSSVLDGAHHLAQLLLPLAGEHDRVDGPASLVFRGDRSLDQLVTTGAAELRVSMTTETATVGFESRRDERGDWRVELTVAKIDANSDGLTVTRSGAGDRAKLAPLRRHAEVQGLGACVRLRLDARAARRPSYSEAEQPRVGFDGSELASTLAWLSSNQREARDAIEQDLALVVPGAKAIRVPRVKLQRIEEEYLRIDDDIVPRQRKRDVVADTIEIEFAKAGFLPIAQLSEGTVLALALLTVLHSPSCPNLVLLDDIEQALHPDAQYELVACIRRVLAAQPHVQVIATTHSPYLRNRSGPAEAGSSRSLGDRGSTTNSGCDLLGAWMSSRRSRS